MLIVYITKCGLA